jgi:Family of unknown function (DUF6502)
VTRSHPPKKPARGKRKLPLPLVSASRGERASSRPASKLREELAGELYSLVSLALGKFGVTASEQQRAIERSRGLKKAPYVSGPLLRDYRGLCSLLLEWSREPEYLDPDGKPRVLAIEGSDATFENLVKRFLPHKPLSDVVAMACAAAEVTTRPGGRIALLGSIMVNVANSTENLLAHAIRQIDQLFETILHNAIVRRKGLSNGHMERMVTGVIDRAEFGNFMNELRPQIYDLLQRVDSSVRQRQPKSARSLRGAAAVSVGIYVSREEDWERAGIDAGPAVNSGRRTKRRRSTV